MKLLLDENLSPRLAAALADLFPDVRHVRDVGLQAADDTAVWDYAVRNDFVIVSKDSDFHVRSLLSERPPKVVWVRLGNASTASIAKVLREHQHDLISFASDPDSNLLALRQTGPMAR